MLGVLITMTTYGTWLRGDRRGWVDDGIVYGPKPELEAADRRRMKYPPFLFETDAWWSIGDFMVRSLVERLQQQLLALTVQEWHVHLVVAASSVSIADVVKCAKEGVRYGLRPGRPIWTDGYDKRYCFDQRSLQARIAYVERHNTERNRPARPWPQITGWPPAARR